MAGSCYPCGGSGRRLHVHARVEDGQVVERRESSFPCDVCGGSGEAPPPPAAEAEGFWRIMTSSADPIVCHSHESLHVHLAFAPYTATVETWAGDRLIASKPAFYYEATAE
jgi:hypothetical protein